jgi:hypothetical protein
MQQGSVLSWLIIIYAATHKDADAEINIISPVIMTV